MKRLVLIDGKSVFYRGYYAMGPLSLSDGTPTGGVYGFAAIATEIVDKLQPTKVVVAWDSKSSTSKRKALYAEYKAGRVKPGEDFYAQIPLLERPVRGLGWQFIELPDFEADDIIGTLSHEADEAGGWETYIISSDLDMLQIVDENTHMWRILKGFSNIEKIDVRELEAKYGILKDQFLDLKALKGDSSDNIPGVPGIGEKTAAKLLNEYGSLDGVYQNIEAISGATQKKLIAGRESAYLSKQLAQIMFDAPVELSRIPEFKFDHDRTIEAFRELEFNSLIRKLEKRNEASETLVSRRAPSRPSLRGSVARVAPRWSRMVSKQNVSDAADESPAPSPAPLIDVPVAPKYISWDIKGLMHSDKKIAEEILKGEKFWDLSQAAFLLNPLKREDPMLVVPEEEYAKQYTRFAQYPKLYKVLTEFDLPLVPVLYKMEEKGMLIDREYFIKLREEYTAEVAALEEKIYKMVGRAFNLNSPMQLSEVLFIDLRLPAAGIKKTTKGYSTGAKELEKLKELHPVIPEIIAYREAAKLLSTYIIPIPDLADGDARIHTTFTQNVTATGRLSSKDPNLQNIPVRTEEGKRIRTGFIVPEGRVLVSADYSQFELRLAAILSGDEALIQDFNNDVDIHTKTAAEAFRVPFAEVTKEQRRAAKVVNFGILYGMSVKGLAEAAHMSIPEAKKFIDDYFNLRAPIKRKLEEILKQAKEAGYVETHYGRRRPTPDVKSPNFVIREAAARAAQNMPIQGTEADLVKRAMIRVFDKLPENADLVMQVHDSLIVECEEKDAEKVAEILKTTMEGVAPELKIKLGVDVKIGNNWGEL